MLLLLPGDGGGSDGDGESYSSSRGMRGELSDLLLLLLLLLSRVQSGEDSSSWSEWLVSVVVAVVGFFEDGGGDGDGDGVGGVGVGAGVGAGIIGSGSGCTGKSIEGGSGGRHFEESPPADAARRLLSKITASSVVRKQLLTALLVAAAAIFLPILDNSNVFLALLLLALPEQKMSPYSMLKGILIISTLKYFTVAISFSIVVYDTLKLTFRGSKTSVQPMESIWRVSRRAGMRRVRPSPGTVLGIGKEKLCLGSRVSGWFCAASSRSVS
jgi:hypothetical protein